MGLLMHTPHRAPHEQPKPKRHEGFQEKVLRKLDHIEAQNRRLMTSVEEVTESFETLKADLEAKAAEAKAEFEKLETEIGELETKTGEEPNLEPLKSAIDSLDASVKAAVVPTG